MNADVYIAKGRITKAKLDRMYNFSATDRRRFMNVEHFAKLQELGYCRTAKYISAKVLQYVIDVLGPPNA